MRNWLAVLYIPMLVLYLPAMLGFYGALWLLQFVFPSIKSYRARKLHEWDAMPHD